MKKYLKQKIKNSLNIEKIVGEASLRSFYRIFFKGFSLVAMVFPEINKAAIEEILKFYQIYRRHDIQVPEIKEVIDNRVILQEDIGSLSVQKIFNKLNNDEKIDILLKIVTILTRLRQIPCEAVTNKLDKQRMRWEMDFFMEYFLKIYYPSPTNPEVIRQNLYGIVDDITNIGIFSHRDFHSRNMFYHQRNLYLIDYQDSLIGPEFYDLVSLSFDAYLDLKNLREFLFRAIEDKGIVVDYDVLYSTALQRNLKALGTFGYQINFRQNLSYKKYLKRTIRHIEQNRLFNKYFTESLFN